jgi:hypothetical protein
MNHSWGCAPGYDESRLPTSPLVNDGMPSIQASSRQVAAVFNPTLPNQATLLAVLRTSTTPLLHYCTAPSLRPQSLDRLHFPIIPTAYLSPLAHVDFPHSSR